MLYILLYWKWNLPALWHRLSNTLSNMDVVKNHITPHCKWLFSLSRNFNLSFGWACLWYYHVLYNFLTRMFMFTLLCQNMHKQSRSIPWPPCHAEVLLQPPNCYSSFVLIIFSIRYLHRSQQLSIDMEAMKDKCRYRLWTPKHVEKPESRLNRKIFMIKQLELYKHEAWKKQQNR